MYRIIKRFIVYFLTICLLFPVLCTDFRSYTDDYSDVVEAIAGRHWLVRDGKQIRQNNEKISARSAIGLKADGTVVTLVTELESYNAEKQQYAFSFDGLLAAELRSVVSVQLYEKDTPVSCTLQYSADTYGNNKTGNLLTLCKGLFAYSDSARSYFFN